ncbi:DUF7116 family protein [Haloarchaeobius sp. HRN-SO-5]|uniref:DUF7116 family protein n=1 Tax=Haloarchaeobius sp. HRN-SO-5 TaxID=3446118 RepID=UPI003EBF8E01
MCPGSTNRHLRKEAESIFSRLGYTVTRDGTEFKAERDWKVVHVTATEEECDLPDSSTAGSYRCFVTSLDHAGSMRRKIRETNPEYEWAVIGVGEEEEYEVERAPPVA